MQNNVSIEMLDSEFYQVIKALTLIIKDTKAGESIKQEARDLKSLLYRAEKRSYEGGYFYSDVEIPAGMAADLITGMAYAMKIMEEKN